MALLLAGLSVGVLNLAVVIPQVTLVLHYLFLKFFLLCEGEVISTFSFKGVFS